MDWVAESIRMPYLVMVGIVCISFIIFCICFCIYEAKNNDKKEDKTDGKNRKKKIKEDKIPDIEMDTFRLSTPPPYTPRGFSLETTLSGEDYGSKKTPLVLRGSSAPQEDKGGGGQGKRSAKEKITSGSRGGQSSWSYVNLAFEKDANLILSPGTLKKRQEEEGTEKEDSKGNETPGRKEETVGEKWKDKENDVETSGKTGDTGTRRKSTKPKEYIELKTFGSVRTHGGVEQKNPNAGEMNTLESKKSWVSSKSHKSSVEGSVKEAIEEKNEREVERETPADGEERARGFRLRHLMKDWDTDVRKRGSKGGGGEEESAVDGSGGGVESVHPEGHEDPPRDYNKDTESEGSPSPSPRRSPVPLSSRFSASTKLLLPLEDEEEEEGKDEVVSRARTLDRGYTTTLTRQQKSGWQEGQISFFDEGKTRDFNYFSAR